MADVEEIQERVAKVWQRIAVLEASFAKIDQGDEAELAEWRRETRALFAELDAIEADAKA